MASRRSAPLRTWLILAFVAIAALPVAGLVMAWSGVYNVAASAGHWAITDWFLEFGMRKSVERRALLIDTPPLDSADLVRLGASHFHSGCAYCHGAPGIPVSPIARSMLPSPPDLRTSMRQWKDRELFWIVKHGIKYTGMPGWVALEREDEIWSLVAFLRRLKDLDPPSYRELSLGSVRVADLTGRQLATSDLSTDAITACARCHGSENQGPLSALVPILHGQSPEFLLLALKAYGEGRRRSGIMQPVASELDAEDMRRLADYYASLPAPARQKPTTSTLIDAGRRLAETGVPERGVPPCTACHGREALPSYPRLAGQHAAYMAGQLRVWKAGHHRQTDSAAIMAPIAERLSAEEIEAVSAYFASRAPEARDTQ